VKNGLSLKNQDWTIRTYAKLKKLGEVEMIADKGESGKSLDRGGMKKLMSLCEQGLVNHLVVYKLDRLSRRTRDLLELVEDVFVTNDVVFHSVTENLDTRTPMGKFFLTLMGALAQMERELIVERIKDALEEKKRRGEPLGSPPLGFKAEDKERIENSQELEIVGYVKALSRKRLSHRDIAKRLNEGGIPTKRGGKWYGSTVSYILKNHCYKRQNLGYNFKSKMPPEFCSPTRQVLKGMSNKTINAKIQVSVYSLNGSISRKGEKLCHIKTKRNKEPRIENMPGQKKVKLGRGDT